MNDRFPYPQLARELAAARELVEAVNNGRLSPPEATRQSRILTNLARATETESRLRDLQQQNDELARLAQMEDALRESEERYRALVENANDIIYTHDLEGNFTSVNAAATRTYGYTTEEILTLNLRDIVDPADLPRIRDGIQARPGPGNPTRYEIRTFTKAGLLIWVEVSTSLIRRGGRTVGIQGVARDITARKHDQEALRQSEAHLRAIFDSADQSIMLIDADFRLLAFNKAAQDVALQLIKAEMHPGDPVLQYITPADRPYFKQHFTEALAGKRQVVERLIRGVSNDDYWWEFSYNSSVLSDGEVTGVTLLGRNITARKQAEATLQDSEDRYRQLVERSPVAIAVHRDNRFLYINPTGQKLLGLTCSEDFLDQPVLDTVHPAHRELAWQRMRQVQEDGREAPLIEEQFVQRDGTVIDVEDICIPFNYQGQPAVQSVFYDVTTRNQVQEALRRSEERFAKTFRASPDILLITRLSDGVILDVNDSWERLVGYPREEAIGRSVNDLYLWAEPGEPAQLAQLLRQQGFVREYEISIKQKSGAICQAVLSIEQLEIAGELCLLAIARDVTDRKHAEQQLRLQAAALEAAANAIVIADRDGVITWVNPAYTRLTGYSAEDTIGQNMQQREAEAQEVRLPLAIWQTLREGRVWHGEALVHRRDGTTYAEEQTITPVLDEQQRITHFIAIKQDITERKQHEQHLSYLVNHDALTGLPNRLWLEQALESAVARSRRGTANALLLLDLDNFKLVNDTLGHAAGDELLAVLAQMLSRYLREGDVLARLGGDEFAVLLDSSGLNQALILAEQLRHIVDSTPFHLADQVFTLGVSIGVVAVNGYQTAQQLLAQADAAMYTAKEQGRNRVALYHPEEGSTRRLSEANKWVTRIKDALRENRLVLHYQPIFRLSDGQVAHYEALLRMREPTGELILPNEFISAAERFGLMPPLDHWVAGRAIQALHDHPDISIVINLSGRSRVDEYLLDFIEVQLRDQNVCPDRLGFEITETAAVQDLVRAEGWIRRLKALGCRFALDDFGVGFTSFAYLRTLPVDQIKIDGSFIRTIHQDSSSRDIVHAMHSLAHKLGKETVAEFVENESILQVLKEIGITYGQGFYLGKPQPSLP